MRKTVCDICGKEMPEMLFGNIGDYKFCISSYGRIWDVCSDCRNDLNKWIEERRKEHDENTDNG